MLADRLQHERAAATAVLIGGSPFEQLDDVPAGRATRPTRSSRRTAPPGRVSAAPAGAAALLDRIDDQVAACRRCATRSARRPPWRCRRSPSPTGSPSPTWSRCARRWPRPTAARRSSSGRSGPPAPCHGRPSTCARLQVEVLQTDRAGGATTPADQQAVLAIQAGYREAMASFAELAPAAVAGLARHRADRPGRPDRAAGGGRARPYAAGRVGAARHPQWTEATGAHIALLHEVERRVDEAVRAEVERAVPGKLGWVVAEAVVVRGRADGRPWSWRSGRAGR